MPPAPLCWRSRPLDFTVLDKNRRPVRAVDHGFELPLDNLNPGAYLLRFGVSSGQISTTREVRFVFGNRLCSAPSCCKADNARGV